MAPLIVMAVAWIVVRTIGFASSWEPADSVTGALRLALSAMFLFTAASHFHPRTRGDLIKMVPTSLPSPSFLVTLTGLFELTGAIGLLVPSTAAAASFGLMPCWWPCSRPMFMRLVKAWSSRDDGRVH